MSDGVIRGAHDVLIVGGGGAGLRAAIAAADVVLLETEGIAQAQQAPGLVKFFQVQVPV